MANSAGKLGRQTIYFRPLIIEELRREASRHDRSISWLLQRAWRLARDEVRSAPARDSRPPAPTLDTLRELDADQLKPRAA
jgi:uncharacterized small protein (TIGR04563 family)